MKTCAIVVASALLVAAPAWAGAGTAASGTIQMTRNDSAQRAAPDNTGINARDRGGNTVTAQKQSENAADRELTQKIRKAIVADDSLSTDAKNVKVVTIDGVVTLRGPVANDREKNAVAAKVNGIPGVKRLENQLEATAR